MGTEDAEMKVDHFWTGPAESLMASLGVTESGLLSLWQKRGAAKAVEGLLANLLPHTPLAGPLDFESLAPKTILILMGIAVVYLVSAEWVKRPFYRKMGS